MSFLWINMLWLLLLVPLLAIIYILVQRRRLKYALRYASLSLFKEAIGHGPRIRRHIPPVLFLIALAAMVLGLARPTAVVTLPSQQATVILTLDVSGSMRAEDLEPNRIGAAKSAARLFVEKQPRHVRIGVVSFSGGASVVQAPTTDREEVLASIDRLTPQRRTAVGSGIITSLEAIFEEQGLESEPLSRGPFSPYELAPVPKPLPPGTYSHAVIILLSDGESNTGPPPLEVAELAADHGVRVYTVGLGSPEGTILGIEGWSRRVRLDEVTLKSIAEKTDARYFKADSETDLHDIYENLSTQLVMETEETELTAGFTALAAVLLLIAGFLSLLWFNRLP